MPFNIQGTGRIKIIIKEERKKLPLKIYLGMEY